MKAEPEAPVPEEREGFVAGCVQHRTGDLLAVLADVTARRLGGALALTRRFDAMAVDALQRMQQQLSKRGGPEASPDFVRSAGSVSVHPRRLRIRLPGFCSAKSSARCNTIGCVFRGGEPIGAHFEPHHA